MARTDLLLVERGLAPSRSAAQRLIARGAVRWRSPAGWAAPRKSGDDLPDDCELRIDDDAELRYVSRGGLKLEGALAHSGIDVRTLACLDLGQSTGGFTDCLLHAGAERVVGVDVGHGQLHESLRADPRVRALEGVNVRTLDAATLGDAFPPRGFDLVVADLSFISLAHAFAPAFALVRTGGQLLALVKPQFELGPGAVDRRGVVRDGERHGELRARIEASARGSGWTPEDWFDSPIAGGDGNREFFVAARK
ncbi:MAG TPA: TlyA family RNA methyltransferase [Zeimonas sp.]